MRTGLTRVLLSAAIGLVVLYQAGTARATPADGFVGTTVALGRFGSIQR